MRVLVSKIDKTVFKKFISQLKLETQINILEAEQISEKDEKLFNDSNCECNSFYIEEQIDNFEIFNRNIHDLYHYVCSEINWNDFCNCWIFFINLQKQKEFGYVMSDIEYVFRKGIEQNLQIEFQKASPDLGFNPNANYSVITGKTETGKMILYKDYEDDIEFVFCIEYYQRKLFSKKTVKRYTHWHPADLHQALKDMINYMKTD